MNRTKIILAILIVALFIFNYSWLDNFVTSSFSNRETVFVSRIIDGDTIVTSDNLHIRLLGINCPEKGEEYSARAKEFLENTILNKTIKLETRGNDLYHRTLAYIFYQNKNINLEIIKNGFANAYFPETKDSYYNQFEDAWKNCVDNNLNFCKKSEDKCTKCIQLKKFDYKNEIITLENQCPSSCDLTDWSIKDEGRKKFFFPSFVLEPNANVEIIVGEGTDTHSKLFWNRDTYVWTNAGDTMFLRDAEGRLVLWENY